MNSHPLQYYTKKLSNIMLAASIVSLVSFVFSVVNLYLDTQQFEKNSAIDYVSMINQFQHNALITQYVLVGVSFLFAIFFLTVSLKLKKSCNQHNVNKTINAWKNYRLYITTLCIMIWLCVFFLIIVCIYSYLFFSRLY
jgi:hypothetical protein